MTEYNNRADNDMAFNAMNNATASKVDGLFKPSGDVMDWLSTILPSGATITGEYSPEPRWSDPTGSGPGRDPRTIIRESDRAPSYAEAGTEFMGRDRLEAWGVPYDQPIVEGSTIKGYDILYRGGPERQGIGQNPWVDYKTDKDVALGWTDPYFGKNFKVAQHKVFDQLREIYEQNPDAWRQSRMTKQGGQWNLTKEQIDEIGATYKYWMNEDSPGYKVASEKFNWTD